MTQSGFKINMFWMPDQVRHDDQRTLFEFIQHEKGQKWFMVTANSVSCNESGVLDLSSASLRNWNNGIVECWNIGLLPHLFDIARKDSAIPSALLRPG